MENHTAAPRRRGKRRKLRPFPILLAGFLIDAIFLCLTAFFLGALSYFLQWKIEHFQTLAAVVYLTDIYLSSLLVSFVAGHKYPLLPLGNGLICLAVSLIPLAASGHAVAENLPAKVGFVLAASFAAYLTIRLTTVSLAPKRKTKRIPIAERSKGLAR